jgi:hypothetical protein
MKIKGYTAEIDTLHRNRWPVRSEDTGFVVGEVVEHITATLDLPQPPTVRWSWRLNDAEADRLGEHWVMDRSSPPRFPSYVEALETFVVFHRSAAWSARRAAQRALPILPREQV